MKTTVITTALLAILFAGCSKEETTNVAPVESSTSGQLTRLGQSMIGTYTVLKYTVDGSDQYDAMQNLRLYIYADGMCETVVNGVNTKGTYKYDSRSKLLNFRIAGSNENGNLSNRTWYVTKLPDRRVDLFANEGNVRLVLYLNYPSESSPL